MKFSNYKISIFLIVFIFVGLTCFKLVDVSQEIIYENGYYENIDNVYSLKDYYVNVEINHCCDGSFYLEEIAEIDNNGYYLYASDITEKLYLLYLSKEDYNNILSVEEIENLIGSVKDIDDEVLNNIIDNNEDSEFYLNDKNTLINLLEKEVYIDTVNINYKSSMIYDVLFSVNLFVSLLGILVCIIILIVKNIIVIKNFIKKHTISKILFILSFIPYFIVFILAIFSAFTGVTWFFDTMYGIEAFNFTILIVLMFFYPLYIIVFIYQLFYIIRYLIKKKK